MAKNFPDPKHCVSVVVTPRVALYLAESAVRESTPICVEPYPDDLYNVTLRDEKLSSLRGWMAESILDRDTSLASMRGVWEEESVASYRFDMDLWLQIATRDQILSMCRHNFRSCEVVDEMLNYLQILDADVCNYLAHSIDQEKTLFVEISGDDVLSWLKDHRPGVYNDAKKQRGKYAR